MPNNKENGEKKGGDRLELFKGPALKKSANNDCPNCKSKKTKQVEMSSDYEVQHGITYHRRECLDCKKEFHATRT